MRKVFWENPYQTQLTTTVAQVDGNRLLFEDTIIYSFAGAQESDKATVNGLPVLSSEIIDNKIFYTLPEGHGLKVGDTILQEIDWARRLKLMRLHFAAEIILELVTQKYGFEKIGAHIAETKSRIDFVTDKNISNIFPDILAQYNKIIESNLPINKDFSDKEKHRRYWKIEGFAQVPCGGTHVNTTGEVGFVNLKRVNIGAGRERIDITLVSP